MEQEREGVDGRVEALVGPVKTAHSLLLNRLVEMQRAPYYATAREELALAEQTVLQLETDATLMSDLLDEAKSLLVEAIPGPDCAYTDWIGARREFLARAGFRPNTEINARAEGTSQRGTSDVE